MDEFDLKNCKLCPVECGADRTRVAGVCGTQKIKIAKYYLHPFEEPCISHKNGSGTIFFCGCNLRCVFCQNYELSRAERGKEITPYELAEIFKELERLGADNVSLVTPSHVAPFLAEAFEIYRPKIPVVYNSSGYDKVETLKKIDKYIDVYLPDLKFVSPILSERFTGKKDYFERASEAILFMAKKPVLFDEAGKMTSGLIVRHLVLPLCKNDSVAVLKWLKKNLPEEAYVSVMSQYTPYGKIENYPELSRKITAREYAAVLSCVEDLQFKNVFVQERSSSDERYIPDWDY